jgi:hypothetical protein
MYAVQIDTDGKPYDLFVAKYEVALSGFVRSVKDTALKTWKTRAGAERWVRDRAYRNANIIEV